MDLKRTINLNKKVIFILVLINIIAISLYYSYALFQVNILKNNVIVLQSASSLEITTTIDNTNTDTFTLPANGNKTVVVHLDTDGITSAMAYKMYYEVTSGYGTFTVTSTESFTNDKVEGVMQPYERTNNEKITGKNITLTFTNSTATAMTIKLGAIGGFEKTGASLTTQDELILNTSIVIPPRYTASELITNIKTNNLKDSSGTPLNYVTETDNNQTLTYLSGCSKYYLDQSAEGCTQDNTIDFNYVWYSGRMWRITSFNETTNTIKLITEQPQTVIAWHDSSFSFEGSYVKQFLNDEFYDSLYNPTDFIDNTIQWNATLSSLTTKPESTTMVTSNVGLLSIYEYYQSYQKVGSEASNNYNYGYLNIGQYWWLLNPRGGSMFSSPNVWNVRHNGIPSGESPTNTNAGRPSINLLSTVNFTGSGTESDPYKIVGDKEVGAPNNKLNTRTVGEYVKLKNVANEQVFRIVGFEGTEGSQSTKLIQLDYVKENGTKVTKKFAKTNRRGNGTIFGEEATIDDTNNTTWYSYLKNVYISDLKTKYGSNLFVSGEYYLGINADNASDTNTYYNYRTSVCASTSDLSKNCVKSRSKTLEVGLLRYGEMFASQHGIGYNTKTSTYNTSDMWLMTRSTATSMYIVFNYGYADYNLATATYAGRPSINLSSDVVILACDTELCDGTPNHPYIVGIPSN